MKNSEITEAFIETNKLHPTVQEIYTRSSDSYSRFKTLFLKKEHLINLQNANKVGILAEIKSIWFTKENSLFIYNYCTTTVEEINGFGHSILFVKIFTPTSGIFSKNINYCLFVLTKHEAIIYAIESDTNNIVYTDFSCKLLSQPCSLEVQKDKLFIGCTDGNVYSVIYKVVPLLGYKTMSLYTTSNFIARAVKTVFRRKYEEVHHLSVGKMYLAALNNNLSIFEFKNNLKSIKTFSLSKKYVSCQILEEEPLLVSCTEPNGNRDFFSFEGKVFSKEHCEFVKEGESMAVVSDTTKQVVLRKSNGISFLYLLAQNEDQLVNFKPDSPSENCEQINVDLGVKSIYLKNNTLIILSNNKIKEYEIFSYKKMLLNCRTEEIYSLHKNYGDLNFMIKYFELLADNENVYKIEAFCKNKNIKRFAFFCYLAQALKKIWTLNLCDIFKKSETLIYFNNLVKKFVNLENKVKMSNGFIDELAQTYYYCSFLNDYNIKYTETLEIILTKSNESFKRKTLKQLLKIFEKNKSIDSLLKTMNNMCPAYLPMDQINNQRGMELLKTFSPLNMKESLKYFTNCNTEVIELFNSQKFYYGSIYILRHSFGLNKVKYETLCNLCKESLKCKGALDIGLEDSRESFLYPLFEALIDLEEFSDCSCCEEKTYRPHLLNIKNPLFEQFLKERKNNSAKTIDLLWKYQLSNGNKEDAIQTLLIAAQKVNLDMEIKVGFLEKALSISPANIQVKRLMEIYKIQKELSERKNLNITRLLTADSLLNDYLYDEHDLAILLLDALDYRSKKIFKEIYKKFITKTRNIAVIFEVLEKLKNKINVLDCFLLVLIEKVIGQDENYKLGNKLISIGFEKSEILGVYRNLLMNSNHPKIKEFILTEMQNIASYEEYDEYKGFCEKTFGIKH